METITAFKCSHCPKKIYTEAKQAKAHEKQCFYNPITRSCASCLWFSPLIVELGSQNIECYLGKLKEVPEGSKMKLNTQCESWMDQKIYFDNETCANQDEMEEKLVSGDVDYFKTLEK